MYSSEYLNVLDDKTRLFLAIGLLGSFTTMSTFSYESFRLVEQKEFLLFGLNLLATITLTLLAIYAGKLLVLNFWRP